MRGCVRLLALVASVSTALAQSQTWCGKNFMANQSVVPPGGQFELPPKSPTPLLAFRCVPGFRPYLAEDGKDAVFIVDTLVGFDWVNGAAPIDLNHVPETDAGNLTITIEVGGIQTTQGVPVSSIGFVIPMDISGLAPQQTPYDVHCHASYQSQEFDTSSSLLYLPDTNLSVTKTDLSTGSLWVRPADGSGGPFSPFVPQGFYIDFDSYLVENQTMIDSLKADGFNTIHPIPPYDNATAFEQLVNKTIELGLYLIIDLRIDYQNLSTVAEVVDQYRSLPNLLLWETAHEPDGKSDPFDAAKASYDLIYQKDGYHPISIVLNCEDYNFTPYVEGADIVLEDAYPLGINATFSPVWHTPCTPDFGHCGCDNCHGDLTDIRARIQTFKNRLYILGYDRTKAVWTTPQAIGSGAYWSSTPTGSQWAAINLISLSHGATGSISFQYPTVTGNDTTIEGTAKNLTPIIAEIVQPWIVNGTWHTTYLYQGVDAGLWYNNTDFLLLVANMNSSEVIVPWSGVGLSVVTNATKQVQRIFSVAQNFDEHGLNFRPGGIGIYTATLY